MRGVLVVWSALAGAVCAGGADLIYVSSDFGHEVLLYDAATGAFLERFISPGSGGLDQPHAIVERRVDVVVASFGTDEILRYDRETGAFLNVFAGAAAGIDNPVYLRYGPDGYLYLSSQASDEILRFCPGGELLDVFIPTGSGGLDGPSGFAFGPDGSLYVAGRYSANVIRYDAASGAFIGVIADASDGLGVGDTFGVNFGDNGDLYFASNGQVFRYDLDSASIVATIPIAFPIGVEAGPPGFVLVASSNNLFTIDTADDSLDGPVLTGGSINVLNFFHLPDEPPPVTHDGDCDGVVTVADFAVFADCAAGPNTIPTPVPPLTADACLDLFDGDHDGDVDLIDWGRFQAAFDAP